MLKEKQKAKKKMKEKLKMLLMYILSPVHYISIINQIYMKTSCIYCMLRGSNILHKNYLPATLSYYSPYIRLLFFLYIFELVALNKNFFFLDLKKYVCIACTIINKSIIRKTFFLIYFFLFFFCVQIFVKNFHDKDL